LPAEGENGGYHHEFNNPAAIVKRSNPFVPGKDNRKYDQMKECETEAHPRNNLDS